MSKPKPKEKPFAISKEMVLKAYQRVKANQGAAGIDGESIEEFQRNLEGNLYKIWNRMSSGTYFPPPVRMVKIPKKGSSSNRVLGVPTVSDRVAQTVAALYLEPQVEPIFHPDSYGYRPGRSPLEAVEVCRQRCWKTDWVIDLDIRSFFDELDHEIILDLVRRHTDLGWILLYVKRWLEAPLRNEDSTLAPRDRGTPQGSPISPLLANIFLHYALDSWMQQEFPYIRFERYCDDVIVHCKSEKQARYLRDMIARRLKGWKLELNKAKTQIVYCKDDNRKGSYPNERFDFLGYTFRPRRSRDRYGKRFVNFSPAVSDDAVKAVRREIRGWALHRRSDKSLTELAQMFNPKVQGWINYYGRFHKSELYPTLDSVNVYLVRWACQKYKRLRRRERRAWKWLAGVAAREPNLFAHWRLGLRPGGWMARAR